MNKGRSSYCWGSIRGKNTCCAAVAKKEIKKRKIIVGKK
jgi:hypothetical protein